MFAVYILITNCIKMCLCTLSKGFSFGFSYKYAVLCNSFKLVLIQSAKLLFLFLLFFNTTEVFWV